jgi:maleate isomerase
MYGYRARIGLIVPSSNTVCEQEMSALCPEGVATYATRIAFEPTIAGLRAMKTHVERASMELSSEGICQILVFCCTVGSLLGGVATEKEIIRLMEETAGIPAITTGSSVIAAFEALGIKRIAVATPYTQEINKYEKEDLEKRGYRITQIRGYHEHVSPEALRNEMIGRLFPDVAFEMGLMVDGHDNEAVFISCTNFRAIEIIQKLEQKTGKQVVTSNQAAMWHALRRLEIEDRIQGYGRLLERY